MKKKLGFVISLLLVLLSFSACQDEKANSSSSKALQSLSSSSSASTVESEKGLSSTHSSSKSNMSSAASQTSETNVSSTPATQGTKEPEAQTKEPEAQTKEPEDQTKKPEAQVKADGVNKAADTISGVESIKNIDALVAIKRYGESKDVSWTEANAVKNLDRANTLEGDQLFYYIVVPKNIGTKIQLYRIDMGEDMNPTRTEVAYQKDASPDDYAVIVNTEEKENGYDFELVATYNGKTATYQFTYDSKGDRPIVEFVSGS